MKLKEMTHRGRRNALVGLLLFITVAVVWIVGYNRNYHVNPDAYDYAQMGREIRAGHGFSTLRVLPVTIPLLAERGYLERERWPNLGRFVLPTLSNAVAQVFVKDAIAASIAQSGLWYLLSVPILFFLALRCTGMTVAILSTLFYVADPFVFESSYNGMTETLASFLILSVLFVTLLWQGGTPKWLLVGVLCGISFLARSNLMYLVPLTVVYALWTEKKPKNFVAATLILASSAIVISPWCVRNQVVVGNPLFSIRTAGALAWGAIPRSPMIQLHEPADVPSTLEKHGPAIRRKVVDNAVDNIVSLTFWDKVFANRGRHYPIDPKKQGIHIPFIFFFFLSLFRRTGETEKGYAVFKWSCFCLLLAGFLMMCLAKHQPRYYVPLRALILVVGMRELVSFFQRMGSLKVRRIVSVIGISLLAAIGVHQYYAVYIAHQDEPDLNREWPALGKQDWKAYELVKETTGDDAIIASDVSYEVCLLTERRSFPLPQDPEELLEIDDDYIRVDYVLIGRRVNTRRVANTPYKAYPSFLSSPEFLEKYELQRKLPNGAVLYTRRTQDAQGML